MNNFETSSRWIETNNTKTKTAPGYKNVATIPSRYFDPIDNNMLGVKHLHYA